MRFSTVHEHAAPAWRRGFALALGLAGALLVVSPVLAAPVPSTPAAVEAGEAQPSAPFEGPVSGTRVVPGTPTGARAAAVLPAAAATAGAAPGTPKTIEMLLEMQGRNAGLEGGDPAPPPAQRRAATTMRTGPGPSPKGATLDPANPFGRTELIAPSSEAAAPTQRIEWTDGTRSFGPAGPGTAAAPATGGYPGTERQPEDSLRGWIPRELAEFIRGNRVLVIGAAIGALLLVWAVTALFAQRSR